MTLFHLYWYLYYGMYALKMIYDISIYKIRFIVYLLTIHEISSLFVSCNDFSMSLFGEKTRLRNMKEVNAQFYLLRKECCGEREISWIKTELHALTASLPLWKGFSYTHYIPIERFAKTWLSSLAQVEMCFLSLLSHHLVREVKGKIKVLIIYNKSVSNVIHKKYPYLRKYFRMCLVKYWNAIIKSKKMHICLFWIDFLKFSNIVVLTRINIQININYLLQMVYFVKGISLRFNDKLFNYLQK